MCYYVCMLFNNQKCFNTNQVKYIDSVIDQVHMGTYGDLENRADISPSTGDLTIFSTRLNDTYTYLCSFAPDDYGYVNLNVTGGHDK